MPMQPKFNSTGRGGVNVGPDGRNGQNDDGHLTLKDEIRMNEQAMIHDKKRAAVTANAGLFSAETEAEDNAAKKASREAAMEAMYDAEEGKKLARKEGKQLVKDLTRSSIAQRSQERAIDAEINANRAASAAASGQVAERDAQFEQSGASQGAGSDSRSVQQDAGRADEPLVASEDPGKGPSRITGAGREPSARPLSEVGESVLQKQEAADRMKDMGGMEAEPEMA